MIKLESEEEEDDLSGQEVYSKEIYICNFLMFF